MKSTPLLVFITLLPMINGFWFHFHSTPICDTLCRCPSGILETRYALDCRDNNITILPDDLSIPDGITRIDFTRNHIKSIEVGTFSSSSRLIGIDFSDNNLQVLSEGVFQEAPSLEVLVFRNNRLHTIEEKAFAGLVNLTKLDLSFNGLSKLPSKVFEELPSLQELILDFNPLINVNEITLAKNPDLHTLHLGSLGIKRLRPEFLPRNLTKLTKLNLAFNALSTIPSKTFFHVGDTLTDLDLSGNPIQILGSYSFYGLKNLRRLRLDQMLKLESIDAFAFGDMTHLETCTLRYMPKIHYLDPMAFYSDKNGTLSAIQLEDFTFSFSILSTLPPKLLDWDKLRHLDLQYNHWNCDCDMQWVKNSTVIKLVGKKLVCSMPLNLRGHRVINIPREELSCSYKEISEKASLGFIIGLLIAGIGVSLATVALLVYWRQGWLFRRPPGAYTQIERGLTEITVVDDMEWDNKDLQKE